MQPEITAATGNLYEWINRDGRQQPASTIEIIGELGAP